MKVIAGTGANSTEEAIWLSREAEEAGVDGVLQVNPYYNKPTQRGLIAHFESVAKSIRIPVVLYNIPGRTGVNFLPASVKELLDRAGNVVAMKEASGDIQQMMELLRALRRPADPSFRRRQHPAPFPVDRRQGGHQRHLQPSSRRREEGGHLL